MGFASDGSAHTEAVQSSETDRSWGREGEKDRETKRVGEREREREELREKHDDVYIE